MKLKHHTSQPQQDQTTKQAVYTATWPHEPTTTKLRVDDRDVACCEVVVEDEKDVAAGLLPVRRLWVCGGIKRGRELCGHNACREKMWRLAGSRGMRWWRRGGAQGGLVTGRSLGGRSCGMASLCRWCFHCSGQRTGVLLDGSPW
jgi:hypothetical protein